MVAIKDFEIGKRIFKGFAFLVFPILLSSCSSIDNQLSVSKPKVYDDSLVLSSFCNQGKTIRELSGKVQENNQLTNEIHTLKEKKKLISEVSVAYGVAAADSAAKASSADQDINDGLSAFQPALSFSARLRKAVNEQEELYGYLLHYTGDAELRSSKRRVALVRFDVSINEYIKGDSLSFNYVTFNFDFKKENVRVYYIGPEYSSIVAEEQLANILVKDYTGEVAASYAGGTAHLKSNLNRTQRESLEYLFERPMKFAIYGNPYKEEGEDGKALRNNDTTITFAFGPRRNIFKRSWYNPRRYFDNTYGIDYIFDTGPRDCYVLFVLEDKAYPPVKIECNGNNKPVLSTSMNIPFPRVKPVSSSVFKTSPPWSEGSENDARIRVFPETINTLVENTIVIESTASLLGGCTVMLGSYQIPSDNVFVIDRFRLKVQIPVSKYLQQYKDASVPLYVLIHDIEFPAGILTRSLNLMKTDAAPRNKPEFSVKPEKAGSGELVSITALGNCDLINVTEIWLNGKENKVTEITKSADKKTLSFKVPSLALSSEDLEVPIIFTMVSADAQKEVKDLFCYVFKKDVEVKLIKTINYK